MGIWGDTKNWLFGDNAERNKALEAQNFQLQGGNYLRDYASSQLGGVQGRQAPTAQSAQLGPAAQLASGPQDQFRQGQLGLMAQMAGVASGQQAGAGELAVRRQANQAAAQQMGAMNMARGANAANAARTAATQIGQIGTNAAGMGREAALSDQMNARGQLAGLMQGARGQDLDLAGQNAAFQQQTSLQQGTFDQQRNLANQAAALQQRGMNDQYGLGLMGQYLATSDAELRARQQRAGLLPQDTGMFGDLLQAGGTLGAAYLGGGRR